MKITCEINLFFPLPVSRIMFLFGFRILCLFENSLSRPKLLCTSEENPPVSFQSLTCHLTTRHHHCHLLWKVVVLCSSGKPSPVSKAQFILKRSLAIELSPEDSPVSFLSFNPYLSPLQSASSTSLRNFYLVPLHFVSKLFYYQSSGFLSLFKGSASDTKSYHVCALPHIQMISKVWGHFVCVFTWWKVLEVLVATPLFICNYLFIDYSMLLGQKSKLTSQWTGAQEYCFILEVICPRCQRKSDVSHIFVPSVPLSYNPPSMFHQTSNPMEQEGGLLMDVEGSFGPTAINSSSARSSLSGWWNLPNPAACHTIQEGLQTNASFMCLLYCFAFGPEQAQAKSYRLHQKPSSASVSVSTVSG